MQSQVDLRGTTGYVSAMSKPLVFISWSGERARVVAKALDVWLRGILQGVETWCSDSTDAGKFWGPEITERLNRAKVGIIIVTAENREKPWLLFEAGAIAKAVAGGPDDARAIPYLFDLEPKDIAPPLSLLHAKKADREGTFGVVQSVNRTLAEPVADDVLRDLFGDVYPRLEAKLADARAIKGDAGPKKRGADEVLAEILDTVRRLDRGEDSPREASRRAGQVLAELASVKHTFESLTERIASQQAEMMVLEQTGADVAGANAQLQALERLHDERVALRQRIEQLESRLMAIQRRVLF